MLDIELNALKAETLLIFEDLFVILVVTVELSGPFSTNVSV